MYRWRRNRHKVPRLDEESYSKYLAYTLDKNTVVLLRLPSSSYSCRLASALGSRGSGPSVGDTQTSHGVLVPDYLVPVRSTRGPVSVAGHFPWIGGRRTRI